MNHAPSKLYRNIRSSPTALFFLCALTIFVLSFAYFKLSTFRSISYQAEVTLAAPVAPPTFHVPPPEPLKAIYMTACVVGSPTLREGLVKLIEDTEINAVVIDVKDYSGTISFVTDNPLLKDASLKKCGAKDMKDFLDSLGKKNIYRIARITVFQDPHYTALHPELAVHRKSATTTPWKDYKGLSFIDVGARAYWDFVIELSKESYALGFDELNFDYIRFPSDGNMADTYFTYSNGRPKAEALEEFFSYLHSQLSPIGAKISADLFGMTTTNEDDLNIGQVLERALPYFDYISPMVYPSHYPKKFNGWPDPNKYPYEVVKFSMERAVLRTVATSTPVASFGYAPIASTSPRLYEKPSYSKLKLRPWLQDFDYGGIYDVPEVKAQVKATYDAGLTSWLLWSPSNVYTRGALLPK